MKNPIKRYTTTDQSTRRHFLRTGVFGLTCATAGCSGTLARLSENGKGSPDTSGMNLVFVDSFKGKQIDQSKWRQTFPWGNGLTTTFNGYASPKNSYISDSNLILKAENKPQQGRDYTTGVLTSRPAFSTGYFEATIKAPPSVPGLFPAFWMKPVNQWPPEIDVMEFFGADSRNWMSYHYKDRSGTVQRVTSTYSDDDFSTEFHRYGVHWAPHKIIWYVDGVERFRYSGKFVRENPMNLIFQFGIDPPFLRSPRRRDLPSYYRVDRIQVWQ